MDTRIRHYKLDIRTPKEDIANKIVGILKINTAYLYDEDDPCNIENIMRLLFKIDDNSNLNIDKIDMTLKGMYSIQMKGMLFILKDFLLLKH